MIAEDLTKLIYEYLDWSFDETGRLFEKIHLDAFSGVRALDLPQTLTESYELNNFELDIKNGGYQKFSIGLTAVWSSHSRRENISRLQARVPLGAAHGSSIKVAWKESISYQEVLKKDEVTLDQLDPAQNIPVNYDLYFGNFFHPNYPTTQDEAANINQTEVAKKIKGQTNDVASIISKKIRTIHEVYKSSGRPITFELPATKGWSLFPALDEYTLSCVVHELNQIGIRAKICIDLGHILSWSHKSEDIEMILALLLRNVDKIGMIHISSAGSRSKLFHQAYCKYWKTDFPLWHLDGLDLMLPVIEWKMIEILRRIRASSNNSLVEVCETRPAEVAIADYFGEYPVLKIKNDYYQRYRKALFDQAKVLGYNI